MRHSRRYVCKPTEAGLSVEEIQLALAYVLCFLFFDHIDCQLCVRIRTIERNAAY